MSALAVLAVEPRAGHWLLRGGYAARVLCKCESFSPDIRFHMWGGNYTDEKGNIVEAIWREDGTNQTGSLDLCNYQRPLSVEATSPGAANTPRNRAKRSAFFPFPECRPLNQTDDIPTGSPHWYISYNPSAMSGYGCATTAVVIGQVDLCWVLCGDHRKALQKVLQEKPEGLSGLVYIMQYVRKHSEQLHSYSDPC